MQDLQNSCLQGNFTLVEFTLQTEQSSLNEVHSAISKYLKVS